MAEWTAEKVLGELRRTRKGIREVFGDTAMKAYWGSERSGMHHESPDGPLYDSELAAVATALNRVELVAEAKAHPEGLYGVSRTVDAERQTGIRAVGAMALGPLSPEPGPVARATLADTPGWMVPAKADPYEAHAIRMLNEASGEDDPPFGDPPVTLAEALRTAEARLAYARESAEEHEDLARQHRADVARLEQAIAEHGRKAGGA